MAITEKNRIIDRKNPTPRRLICEVNVTPMWLKGTVQ
jgi:hypothetical protein